MRLVRLFLIQGGLYLVKGGNQGDKLNSDFSRAFAELPRSISDAAQFYRAEERNTADKLFWMQYLVVNYPVPFSDQLKQLVELHKEAEIAMKDLIIRIGLPSRFRAVTSG